MCFEGRWSGESWWYGGCAGGQDMAVDEDVLVSGAAAFGRDDVGEVGEGDFVDDADHGFGPGGVVVGGAFCGRGWGEERGFFGGKWRGLGGFGFVLAVYGVCETGL